MKDKITGIILLAGNSTRYGKNKNLELVHNKYIFQYSLEVFNNSNLIDDIVLVTRESDKDLINTIILNKKYKKNIKLIKGGNTRSESVYNALISTDSKIVVIHDAARPLIQEEYISNSLEYLKDYMGAIIGVKVKDTIKITNDDKEILESTKRINTYIAQTPQVFFRELLLNLYLKYKNDLDITDDSMLLEREGYKVKIVDGDYSNIKITTKDDMTYVKEYIKTLKKY